MLSRSFGEIAAAAAADIHPPGYYWLLKVWSLLFGDSAAAMRGLSATLGVLLVALIVTIAFRIAHERKEWRSFPVLAALLAALNAFQIYYSQEARMYLLLAVEAAGLFWALLWMMEIGDWRLEIRNWRMRRWEHPKASAAANLQSPISNPSISQSPNFLLPSFLYLLFGVAGLWTHYSFPIVLAAAGMAFVLWWAVGLRRASPTPPKPYHPIAPLLWYIGLNLLLLLAFLPWLPTAVERVLNWPKGGGAIGPVAGLALTLRTLLFGPLRTVPDPLWPWLVVAGLLPLIGLFALRRRPFAGLAVGLWLLLPIAMMFGLGLFTDAFLKFLLVASPAWCLLAAATPWTAASISRSSARVWQAMLWLGVASFGVAAALATLPTYYADAQARDNYQGIARYLSAVGAASTDLVVLDAPGQQEVWRYYDSGLPVLALPAQRPADAADVEAQLAEATAGKRRVHALFWATDEADPQQLVERWLDAHAFKSVESWQGNLRFVTYALANNLAPAVISSVRWENGMILAGVEQPAPGPQRVAPGDAALVRLTWLTDTPLTQRYKVSVQLLDARNQVIAQHDSEPAGGARPTDAWQPGERVGDNHGIAIPLGTPPGLYRMMLVLYDAATGARVKQYGQEMLPIGAVAVEKASQPPPVEIIPLQHRLHAGLGPVQLVGYDAHRLGAAHAPQTPLQAGDAAHFTLYWQAPDPLPADWPADLMLTLRLGDQQLSAPLAGGAYPTAEWSAGELVRGTFDLLYDGKSPRPVIEVGNASLTVEALPVE
ncbi:MAG: hypothetical protein IPM07_02455 [Anaerolineales bacterium]|nr:hypothetical protein [Anaerolineales bacterium]